MNIDSQHPILGTILLIIGTFSASLTLTDIDFYLSIILKLTSIASFICYMIINYNEIKRSWVKFKNNLKKK